jgi:pilus assembly protein CpaB
MKITQIVFLGVAVAAGAAAFMMSGANKPAPAKIVTLLSPSKMETVEVLVAAHDIPMGAQVSGSDLSWQPWPKPSYGSELVTKTSQPNAVADIQGSVARASFIAGEPILKEKLVKGPSSGFLAAILPEGERAVAINIDSQGATTAGGFILPNDRVDVIRTSRDDDAAKAGNADAYKTETILSNIRVLAIGQNIQEKNNERVVVGSNATLEVTPKQAELLVEAQRVGQLSLALRSMLDADQPAKIDQADDGSITVVRYGVALTSTKN